MNRLCLLLSLLTVFAVASCVYDFHSEIVGEAGYVAIEGDILIGDTSRFDVRLSTNLESQLNAGDPLTYTLQVESSGGAVYPLQDTIVVLTDADVSQEYRLVVEVTAPFKRTYASQWAPVEIAPQIDSLTYVISEDRSRMDIKLSTHSDGPTGYLHWDATEIYEYHSATYAVEFYVPAGTVYKGKTYLQGGIIPFEDDDNYYYCWKSQHRSEVMTASTMDLAEDKLVDHLLYSFSNMDREVSLLYFVEITQTRLSEEGYRYWEKMRSNSTDVGGLFSPEPSELRGNIVNVDNPDELVLGFIGVSTTSRVSMFIDNYKLAFSQWRGPFYGDMVLDSRTWYANWRSGFRFAFYSDDGSHWFPGECVDCTRLGGGTKDRPSWWPNDHK
jgi:hypothetical protein